MALQLATPPASEPITVAEAAAHMKTDSGEDMSYLSSLIATVREMAEQETLRSLMTQTWRKTIDAFPGCMHDGGDYQVGSIGGIRLDRPPIQSVTSVKYYDESGTQQTLSPSSYQLDLENEPGWIVPAYGYTWPLTQARANAVEVIYVAGYADAASVPDAIKTWMKVMLRQIYDNPASGVDGIRYTPLDYVGRLLDRYRGMRS